MSPVVFRPLCYATLRKTVKIRSEVRPKATTYCVANANGLLAPKGDASGPVRRILCPPFPEAATISLGPHLRAASNDLPEALWVRVSPRNAPYLVFLRMGFALPAPSPWLRCALTAPFHPYRASAAVCFLWHFPWPRGRLPLATILTRGVRTFLSEAGEGFAAVAWATRIGADRSTSILVQWIVHDPEGGEWPRRPALWPRSRIP